MAIKEVLEELVRTPGIDGAILVSKDGFVIDSAATQEINAEEVGAIFSGATSPSEMIGDQLGIGSLKQTMLEYENGIVIIVSIKESFLAVIAGNNANLGLVRISTKKARTELEQLV